MPDSSASPLAEEASPSRKTSWTLRPSTTRMALLSVLVLAIGALAASLFLPVSTLAAAAATTARAATLSEPASLAPAQGTGERPSMPARRSRHAASASRLLIVASCSSAASRLLRWPR